MYIGMIATLQPFPIRGAIPRRLRKIYGRLDCQSALRWIAKDHYVKHRVFFRDEKTAVAAGYRPCACCLKVEYLQWKTRVGDRETDA